MAVDSQWANVSLLLPMEGANNQTIITDVRGHVITTHGGVKLTTAQAPAGCTTSMVLDGNNDYLTLSGADLALGSGDWAIELPAWRIGDTTTGSANSAHILDFRTADTQVAINLYVQGSGAGNHVAVYINGADRITSSTAISTAFKFITLARVGNTLRLFFDGVQEGSNYDVTGQVFSTTNLTIGGRYAALSGDYRGFNGYLGPVRITVGSGRGYSTTFTPPSLPLPRPTISGHVYDASAAPTAKTVVFHDRGTQAFVGGANSDPSTGAYSFNPTDFGEYGAVRLDELANPYWGSVVFADRLNASGFPSLTGQTLTATGTVTASTAVADPFGGSEASALFTGDTSRLAVSGTTSLGTAYTIRGWLRADALTSPESGILFIGTFGSDSNRVQIELLASGAIEFYSSNTGAFFDAVSAAGVIATGTWYHFASVKNGTNAYVFIGGALVASAVASGAEPTGTSMYLGYCRSAGASRGLVGRLYGVEVITRAEYLAPFTPPTMPFLAGPADGTSGENALIYDRATPGAP